MLGLIIAFLLLALISGFLGFSGVAIISVQIARILFYIFAFLFIATLIMRLLQRPKR